MPTSEAFFAAEEICSNLARMHNNIRENVRIIQAAYKAGTLAVPVEQAFQDLGKSFQQRLGLNDVLSAKFPSPLKIDPGDIAAVQADLRAYVNRLAAATPKDVIEVDAIVADAHATVTEWKGQLGSATTLPGP